MFSPMNLTHPSWEYDPDFDIRNHIRRVTLSPPGTEAQLSDLAGEIFTPLMDRNRPLWDLTVINGLERGRSALILRVHHCMVDGVSGIGLMNVMFDPSRQPRQVEPQPYNPPPLPDSRQLLVEGLSAGWAEAAERLIGAQLNILRFASAFLGESSNTAMRSLAATVPELLRPAERLPFNAPCSGVRGYCWTTMPFGEARMIRSMLGGTINDVVLTIVTGAVSRYVTAHREPVQDRLVRLMVPVNLRTDDGKDAVGNNISMLPLNVPLDIEDPLERLKAITARTCAMKSARIADLVSLIGTSLGWIPPGLQHPIASLPFMPQPVLIVNMVCTNVPGPMVPLYANGRELITYYPYVPCGSEVGLSVAISSYNQNLNFGVTYDAQAAPDGELFRDFLIESRDELRMAAGLPAAAMPPVATKAPSPAPLSAAGLRAHRISEEPIAAVEPEAPEPLPVVVPAADQPSAIPPPRVPAAARTVPGPSRGKKSRRGKHVKASAATP
jgi:WS/DGAT/MGAT family acyltransferase